MSFTSVVKLYREVGRPAWQARQFHFNGAGTREIIALVEELKSIPNTSFGSIELKQTTLAPGEVIDFTYTTPANEHGRFHANIKEFIDASKSLNKGIISNNFYISDKDYALWDGAPQDENIKKLIDIVHFISLLEKFSDSSIPSSGKGLDLVFVSPARLDKPAKTIVLNTTFTYDDLDYDVIDIDLLGHLSDIANSEKLHIEERKSLLRLAIADVLSSKPEDSKSFPYLIRNWETVIRKYRHDFDCYVNEFSFDKIRKDIAKAELDFASGMNSVLSDMTGKLLAIPLSFAGVVTFATKKNLGMFEYWVLFFGIWVVCFIMCLVLFNQLGIRKRIFNSFHIVFDQFEKKIDNYSKDVQAPLKNACTGVKKQDTILLCSIRAFLVLAISPGILATIYMINQHWEQISNAFKYLLRC